jgi:Spy/CpxP family protein refolding chaperone
MKTSRFSLAAVVLCLMAATAMAQPRGERQGRGPGGPGGPGGQGGGGMMFLMGDESPMKRMSDAVAKLDLTSEQKEKLAELKKEYEPKFKEIREKLKGVLNDDQKKIVADVQKTLKDATGEDRREAFQKVGEKLREMNLTDEQKEKMRDIGQEGRKLGGEVREKVRDVLTDEQKEKLDKAMQGFRGGRGGRGPRGGDENGPKPKEKEST